MFQTAVILGVAIGGEFLATKYLEEGLNCNISEISSSFFPLGSNFQKKLFQEVLV